MLVKFSTNPFQQFLGIAYYNRWSMLIFLLLSGGTTVAREVLDWHFLEMDIVPISILGGALAIFFGLPQQFCL